MPVVTVAFDFLELVMMVVVLLCPVLGLVMPPPEDVLSPLADAEPEPKIEEAVLVLVSAASLVLIMVVEAAAELELEDPVVETVEIADPDSEAEELGGGVSFVSGGGT
jgi:hypothetical protein